MKQFIIMCTNPNCKVEFEVNSSLGGKIGECGICGETFKIPMINKPSIKLVTQCKSPIKIPTIKPFIRTND